MNNVADFKRADLNHDGRVDPYEMQVYRGGRFGVGNCKYSNARRFFKRTYSLFSL